MSRLPRSTLILLTLFIAATTLLGLLHAGKTQQAIAATQEDHQDLPLAENPTDYLIGSQEKKPGSDEDISAETVTWREVITSTAPPARDFGVLVYDSSRDVTVMFGGADDNHNFFGDRWEWDGEEWAQRFPLNSPSARNNHALAFDSTRGVSFLFAGFDGGWPADTWDRNGTNWIRRFPQNIPPGPIISERTT